MIPEPGPVAVLVQPAAEEAAEVREVGDAAAAEIERVAQDIERVVSLLRISEYKRRQAAPGLKVTTRAFGMGRRIPIAQRYRES